MRVAATGRRDDQWCTSLRRWHPSRGAGCCRWRCRRRSSSGRSGLGPVSLLCFPAGLKDLHAEWGAIRVKRYRGLPINRCARDEFTIDAGAVAAVEVFDKPAAKLYENSCVATAYHGVVHRQFARFVSPNHEAVGKVADFLAVTRTDSAPSASRVVAERPPAGACFSRSVSRFKPSEVSS